MFWKASHISLRREEGSSCSLMSLEVQTIFYQKKIGSLQIFGLKNQDSAMYSTVIWGNTGRDINFKVILKIVRKGFWEIFFS